MKFLFPLEKTKIIKRYKRFFADLTRSDGSVITVHVPNTGPMIGAWQEGWDCYIMPKADPKKMTHGAELTQSPDKTLMGINTQIPNKLIKQALENHEIKEINNYNEVIPEYTIGKSKLDFLLKKSGKEIAFIEVKNCSGKIDKTAFFPDTVSERAVKHLEELISLKKKGFRTILIFVVQRGDVEYFTPGDNYHPEYGEVFRKALNLGVEILAFSCEISLTEIHLGKKLKIKV